MGSPSPYAAPTRPLRALCMLRAQRGLGAEAHGQNLQLTGRFSSLPATLAGENNSATAMAFGLGELRRG